MAIKIKDIPPEGLTLELDQKLDLFDQGTASTAFTAVLTIKPTGNGNIGITGKVKSAPLLECNRCLKHFAYNIDSDLNIHLAPVSSMENSPEHELSSGDLDVEFYQGDEIEPAAYIKEQLLISIPMVPVHSPDCKGLCPVCGKDRNLADCGCSSDKGEDFGPFSVLKDIFKK
jgi:uncharacterized protein